MQKFNRWRCGGTKTPRGKMTLVNRCKGITLDMTYLNTFVGLSTKNSTTRNIVSET
jgi:hypothetical protein